MKIIKKIKYWSFERVLSSSLFQHVHSSSVFRGFDVRSAPVFPINLKD